MGVISITPPSFMKFCPVVPEICRGQVHGARKERIIIIIRRNGAKSIIKSYLEFLWYCVSQFENGDR
jgi:hypothetical protein